MIVDVLLKLRTARERPDPQVVEAVFAARAAALGAIRPGASASAVDQAARSVLEARGFGKAFKHSTGHGVGFGAINHGARPRLHPRSDDQLRTGMVFNVEPAVYLDGWGRAALRRDGGRPRRRRRAHSLPRQPRRTGAADQPGGIGTEAVDLRSRG